MSCNCLSDYKSDGFRLPNGIWGYRHDIRYSIILGIALVITMSRAEIPPRDACRILIVTPPAQARWLHVWIMESHNFGRWGSFAVYGILLLFTLKGEPTEYGVYMILICVLGLTVDSLISGGHYSKESSRGGGHDLHNFISSGFVTLGRGHAKGNAVLSWTKWALSNNIRLSAIYYEGCWGLFNAK